MLSSSLRLLWDALFSRSGFESRPFRKNTFILKDSFW
jgi:hypothetical protein